MGLGSSSHSLSESLLSMSHHRGCRTGFEELTRGMVVALDSEGVGEPHSVQRGALPGLKKPDMDLMTVFHIDC